MNYYSHHIGDFIRDTARIPDAQCMAYLRLIWMYYETESPIQNDIDAVAFKIGANVADLKLILAHFFFLHDDNCWHQSRCDREILEYRAKSKKCKDSANARWKNANAMRTHNERNADEPKIDANQEPRTNNHKEEDPLTPKGGVAKATRASDIAQIPASLDSESFRAAWEDFKKHRIEKRCKMTPTMSEKLLEKLEKHGEWVAIQAIKTSIENGWQGVFPEKVINSDPKVALPFPEIDRDSYTTDPPIIDRMGW